MQARRQRTAKDLISRQKALCGGATLHTFAPGTGKRVHRLLTATPLAWLHFVDRRRACPAVRPNPFDEVARVIPCSARACLTPSITEPPTIILRRPLATICVQPIHFTRCARFGFGAVSPLTIVAVSCIVQQPPHLSPLSAPLHHTCRVIGD